MKWIKYEGYDEIHQLVSDDGQIVGEVAGSVWQKDRGWWARDERGQTQGLGRFISCDSAKKAVERALGEVAG